MYACIFVANKLIELNCEVADWIQAFLNDHTQQVVVDCKSDNSAV